MNEPPVSLTLAVVSHHGRAPAAPLSARFDASGGSIGREDGNRLILADEDRVISRIHGEIHYDNGRFIYADRSSNGTELCGQNRRLLKESVYLYDGDRLQIGDYELEARLEPGTVEFDDPPLSAPGYAYDRPESDAGVPITDVVTADSGEPALGQGFQMPGDSQAAPSAGDANWLVWEDGHAGLPFAAGPPDAEADGWALPETRIKPEPACAETPTPPPADALAPGVQADAPAHAMPEPEPEPDPPAAARQRPTPRPTPAAKTEGGANLFHCFLQGAGLDLPIAMSAEEQADAMCHMGSVFRHMVDGMMTALQARAQEKYAIRADVTRIKREQNNPLKFSPKVEGAVSAMLCRQHKEMGYLDPVEAIEEGFKDIRNHELAMRAAMQAAVAQILRTFDPGPFEQSLDGMAVFQFKKAKCWEAYCAAYPKLASAAMEGLFGHVFVQAYEEQVRKLNQANGKY